MNRKIFQSECKLDVDSFNNQALVNNLEALAQVCQNVIIHEQGCYPNQPQLGVGIANYEFELSDLQTKSDLEAKIKEQVNYFVPNDYIMDIALSTTKTKSNLPILVVLFYISEYDRKRAISDNSEAAFAIVFSKNNKNKKILSNIIY